jgi:hypothetical protein
MLNFSLCIMGDYSYCVATTQSFKINTIDS